MKVGDFVNPSSYKKLTDLIDSAPESITSFKIDNSYQTFDNVIVDYKLTNGIKIKLDIQLPKETKNE